MRARCAAKGVMREPQAPLRRMRRCGESSRLASRAHPKLRPLRDAPLLAPVTFAAVTDALECVVAALRANLQAFLARRVVSVRYANSCEQEHRPWVHSLPLGVGYEGVDVVGITKKLDGHKDPLALPCDSVGNQLCSRTGQTLPAVGSDQA